MQKYVYLTKKKAVMKKYKNKNNNPKKKKKTTHKHKFQVNNLSSHLNQKGKEKINK